MSLKKCPECHKKVSDQATHCVKCGYPFRKNKVVHMHIPELEDMRAILKGINKNLEEMKHSDIDENSISITFFKGGIVALLVIAFLILLIAAAISIFDIFSEVSILCVLFSSVFVAALVSMITLIPLSNLEKNTPKKKKTIKCISVICCIVICVYIVISSIIMLISDMLIHDQNLMTCSILHMIFGGLGFLISLMIQEVWHTKDKPFIFAFISLVWALIVGIIT
ncbi:MAG: zinc ribbon domain-containing protein [Ruminococcus sp.]|nr:zinc ribbon domain-containing protein [Ruminococcus sp.]